MTDRAFDLQWLRHQSIAMLWLFSVSGFIIIAAAVDSAMDWLQEARVTSGLVLTEAAIAFIAAGAFALILAAVLERWNLEIRHRRELDAALAKADERSKLQARVSHQHFLDYDVASDTMQFPAEWLSLMGCEQGARGSLGDFLRCMEEEDRAMLEAAIRNMLEGKGPASFQLIHRAKRPGGAPAWLSSELHVYERDGKGLPSRLLIGSRDITERKRIEEFAANLRQEMESQQALQVTVQTAAAIAHELNQPLSAVASYCFSALNLLDGLREHDQVLLVRILQKAVWQAEQAGKVVHELLEFLQRDGASSEIVDLNDAIREAVRLAHAEGHAEAQFQLDLDPALKPVHVNRLHVEKVVANLIRNGLEAMAGAGMLPAERLIEIQTAQQDGMAHVSIRDHGPGIDEQAAEHLFQPFYTTRPGGIGMGLVTSRALVESGGGRIWFEPAVGGGAVFHFTFPIVQ